MRTNVIARLTRADRRRGAMRRPWLRAVALIQAMALMIPIGAQLLLAPASAAVAPTGQGFTVTASDLAFILKQIKIAEHHAATLTPANPCGTLVGPVSDNEEITASRTPGAAVKYPDLTSAQRTIHARRAGAWTYCAMAWR